MCDTFVAKASTLYARDFATPEVVFDLRGKAAGMYQVAKQGRNVIRRIRINPWLAAKYFDETLSDTAPHEVAHFIVDSIYGARNIRPHGKEWKTVMVDFGIQPLVRGNYSLEGIPVKQYQRFEYVCTCKTHWLTVFRHKKIQYEKSRYLCRRCGEQLEVV